MIRKRCPILAADVSDGECRFRFDGEARLGRTAQAAAHGARAGEKSRRSQAAGYLIVSTATNALGNKEKLFAYHKATNANYTLTVRTTDGTGSGWAGAEHPDWKQLDVNAVSCARDRQGASLAQSSRDRAWALYGHSRAAGGWRSRAVDRLLCRCSLGGRRSQRRSRSRAAATRSVRRSSMSASRLLRIRSIR